MVSAIQTHWNQLWDPYQDCQCHFASKDDLECLQVLFSRSHSPGRIFFMNNEGLKKTPYISIKSLVKWVKRIKKVSWSYIFLVLPPFPSHAFFPVHEAWFSL